ncbi:MAG: ATP-binding protein [Ekhidna sp.]|nr:ATP-binding protein [Ekhidna sp.]
MIVEFSISNYKSFKTESTLSFIGSNTTKEHEVDNTFKWKDYKFLKANAIYGANASGKSNLVNALSVMKRTVMTSFQNALAEKDKNISIVPFKLNSDTINKPTTFEIVFIADEKQYRYGFELKDHVVSSEWLFHIPRKIETFLFIRENNEIKINKTHFKEGIGLEGKTRENVLFLSVCSQFNGAISNIVINWFKELKFISGLNDDTYRGYTTYKLKEDKKFNKWINNFIKFLEISKVSVEEELIESLNIDELEFLDEEKELKVAFKALSDWREKQQTVSKLKSWHHVFDSNNLIQDSIQFDFDREESKGTQRLIYILGPIYDSLVNGKVLFIDELDSRLHSLLTREVISLFHKFNKNNAQFAFVLHDTNILKTEIFRRDQLWFVEKNQVGYSNLYSLYDYGKVRKDAKFEEAYLKGNYGAVPQLDWSSDLIDKLYEEE